MYREENVDSDGGWKGGVLSHIFILRERRHAPAWRVALFKVTISFMQQLIAVILQSLLICLIHQSSASFLSCSLNETTPPPKRHHAPRIFSCSAVHLPQDLGIANLLSDLMILNHTQLAVFNIFDIRLKLYSPRFRCCFSQKLSWHVSLRCFHQAISSYLGRSAVETWPRGLRS